jgi:hypothetical protein
MGDKVEIKEEVKREKQLKIADRCDRCNAQAFILAKGIQGELYFCGHHYNKYKENVDSWAFEVINEIDSINERSASSNI